MNRKAAAVGALALAGTLLAAVPAQADSAPRSDGAKSVCKRLPTTQERVDKAVRRLNGDATVAGSVARLQQRVTDAKVAGHTEMYTYLNDRLTFRKTLLPALQTRQADLKSVATWCAAQPSPAASK
ncbi:hypothetical protein OG689_39135 [Kitasatospora sp. NBC_00240]|uniref:hypothetical protein n=1 Tax=Kitasatospora sp. NBC_00240 TaxID=2903567 RepID=UPI002252C32F|nr:hypothetical protein [Kitasatospora sp. NBC_00240]MCX5215210.1 hypothetical protein [Kitasatospora sp. NBC_00240]